MKIGQIIHGLISIAKWLLYASVALSMAFVVWRMETMGRAVLSPVWWITDKIGLTQSVPEKPLTERVPIEADKCRAYTFLADFNGSKQRLEADKIRLMCTIIRLEETGVDPCDIFAVHMELVPPGWGRRKMSPYNPFLGRYTYVPKRRNLYVEARSTQAERDSAALLAVRIKDQKLCPADWKATTLIRPDSDDTLAANQTAEEKAAIKKMTRQVISGAPSEFEFYYK